MGNQLIWDQRYNIGVESIDKGREKLFHILNKLFAFGRQQGKSRWACREAVKYFKEYAAKHFADEEDYMASIAYEGLAVHKRIHDNFRERTLPALEKELERTNYSESSVHHFLGVCAGWLVGHTLIEDPMIVGGDPLKHWENLLPEEEQAVMGLTIAGLMHSMFELEPRLISNCYGGEKFGDGIYYRLIYSTKGEKDHEIKKLEVFLVFEQQMIVSTIGSVLDFKAASVSVMLMNAARYTARQLVERAMRCFPAAGQFEIKDEQLLTYEQFFKIYEKLKPQYSLLFDTGKGYFAYCMAAAGQSQNAGGVSIIMENAMEEVERYLNQNKEKNNFAGRKKRLLVVDDSEFMLAAMESLFGRDYEVAAVKSGLSAIRSITLARPDLILLDYEMPVCDGKQVLEMIRSEKEFTDIPVMFLTNKVDTDSVRQAIALKPEGYLLKSQPVESVKKEVDLFFEKKGGKRK